MIKKISGSIIITFLLLLLIGCEPPVDVSKAQVNFKHTLKLPGGFSIESSVPLNISALEKVGQKNPDKIYEQDKFSIPIEIKNDNQNRKNTKIRLEYSQNNLQYLYLYFINGEPLNIISPGLFEYDNDAKAQSVTTVYLAGATKELPKDYPFVGIDFKLNYLDENDVSLASNSYQVQVFKINYTIPNNVSN